MWAEALAPSCVSTWTLNDISRSVQPAWHLRIRVQVGDNDRGYVLELMLTKLRYAMASSRPAQHGSGSQPESQAAGAMDWTTVHPAYVHGGLQVRPAGAPCASC